MGSGIRQPVAAGSFYERTQGGLSAQLNGLLGPARVEPAWPLATSVGLVVPHAGYLYSGPIAAAGYRWLAARGVPECVMLLGANHTGWGPSIAMTEAAAWESPLGVVPVAEELRNALEDVLPADEAGFVREHSEEVQLPFLQHLFGKDFTVLPVSVGTHDHESLRLAARGIVERIGGMAVALIASSDFTHYEPQSVAEEKDRASVDLLLRRNADGFLDRVVRGGLTICGAGAIALLLLIGEGLGWADGELLAYGTSGDITGDRTSVVGYAALGWKDGD